MQTPLNESVQVKPKRMMTVDLSGPKAVVHINYSSLEILNACHRKAYYFFERNLRGEASSPALTFGVAIHRGLETWYRGRRERCASGDDTAAIDAFRLAGSAAADNNDKRSTANGEKILRAYFKQYADDPFELYHDEQGPFVERSFSFHLFGDEHIDIHWTGVIDCVLRNPDTNGLFVCDHKTTSALGAQFFDRINPNWQYVGYVMGAKKAFGIDTNTYMVNALQVAKTKQEFARQFHECRDELFEEFTLTVVEASKRWVNALRSNKFPMNAPTPCSSYGGCQYLELCSVPSIIRENVIKNRYNLPQQSPATSCQVTYCGVTFSADK